MLCTPSEGTQLGQSDCHVSAFPAAPVTNCHQLTGLEQHKFTISVLDVRSPCEMSLQRLTSRHVRAFSRLRGKATPLPFLVSGGGLQAPGSWPLPPRSRASLPPLLPASRPLWPPLVRTNLITAQNPAR